MKDSVSQSDLKRCIISNIREQCKCVRISFNLKLLLDTWLKELINICKINSKFDRKVEIVGRAAGGFGRDS